MIPLKHLKNNSKVADVDVDQDGYFVYLKNGWTIDPVGGCHCYCEDTIKGAYDKLKSVVKCSCNDCKNNLVVW